MKFFMLLLMIVSPLMAQETQEEPKREMSPFLKKRIGRFGYTTLEEYHQNMYTFTTLGSANVLNFSRHLTYYSTGVSLEFGGLFHRKSKMYSVSLVNIDYLLNSAEGMPSYKIGYRYGLGISFYDKRDHTGAGWLLGINGEVGMSYVSTRNSNGYSAVGGMNFRALYRNNYGIGMSISLLVAYNYTTLFSDTFSQNSYGSHGFEIKPSIGIAY